MIQERLVYAYHLTLSLRSCTLSLTTLLWGWLPQLLSSSGSISDRPCTFQQNIYPHLSLHYISIVWYLSVKYPSQNSDYNFKVFQIFQKVVVQNSAACLKLIIQQSAQDWLMKIYLSTCWLKINFCFSGSLAGAPTAGSLPRKG